MARLVIPTYIARVIRTSLSPDGSKGPPQTHSQFRPEQAANQWAYPRQHTLDTQTIRRGPREDARTTAQTSYAPGGDDRTPKTHLDANGYSVAYMRHHGARDAPQKVDTPPLEQGYQNGENVDR